MLIFNLQYTCGVNAEVTYSQFISSIEKALRRGYKNIYVKRKRNNYILVIDTVNEYSHKINFDEESLNYIKKNVDLYYSKYIPQC